MEGIATFRRVGEIDISSTHSADAEMRYGDDLYIRNIAHKTGIESKILDDYLYVQETTHIKEGLRLQQRSVSEFMVQDGSVRDSFGEALVDVARRGHDYQKQAYSQGQGFDFMVRRTAHDIEIATDNDLRMNTLDVGQSWFRVTPYAEEVSDEVAKKAGFWPAPRRAFIWLYRKKSEHVLETTIISVDQSDVSAFAGLLSGYGVELPTDITSHDAAGYVAEITRNLATDGDREEMVDQITEAYASSARYVHAPGEAMTSDEFVSKYAQEDIHSIIRLQKEITHSLESRSITPYVREATLAVLKEQFIDDNERADLMKLINTHRDANSQTDSLRLLIKAHRVGVWRNLSQKIESMLKGEEIEPPKSDHTDYAIGGEVRVWEREQLNHNTNGTTQVVNSGETMPGCPGGSSFTSKSEEELKENAFKLTDALSSGKKWMNCPFCKEKDAVYADVCAKDLKCRHCNAEVQNGKVTSKGRRVDKKTEKPKKAPDTVVANNEEKVAPVTDLREYAKRKKSKIQRHELH